MMLHCTVSFTLAVVCRRSLYPSPGQLLVSRLLVEVRQLLRSRDRGSCSGPQADLWDFMGTSTSSRLTVQVALKADRTCDALFHPDASRCVPASVRAKEEIANEQVGPNWIGLRTWFCLAGLARRFMPGEKRGWRCWACTPDSASPSTTIA
jgi:hypothetical protein